ncbi:MAG: TonB-dependent receptor [Aquincola sp.]|nr:TonB-dependent receptor [Aquincola sp.]
MREQEGAHGDVVDLSRSDLLEIQDGPTTEGSAVARAIRPAGRHYDYAVDGRTVGAFAQLRWAFRPGWRVGAALRLERTEYEYNNRMLAGNTSESGVPCAFGGCLFSRPADRDDQFDNASPRFELDYAPKENQRL